MKHPKIALSTRYSRSPEELLAFVRTHGLDGIEHTIWAEDHVALEKEKPVMRELAASDVEIRYHFQLRRVELAHRDRQFAVASASYLKHCLDFLHEIGGKAVITHLCLGYRREPEKMSLEHAVAFLTDLVAHARGLGIEVCLENLTYGLVNTPGAFRYILEQTGASATIDIGHAAASPCVLDGEITAPDYIRTVAPWLRSAHIYDIELPDPMSGKFLHHAPKDRNCLEERIRTLAETPCEWWLVELGDTEEILRTVRFLKEILADLPS